MVNAIHSGGIMEDGKLIEGGDPAGFVIEFPDGLVVYQAGDTDVFGDMALIAEIYRPTVAVLPIGDHFTMGPRQAAHAVRLLGVKQVLSGHFGTFPVLVGTPAELRKLVPGDVEVPDMTPGIRLP
jgi:L-ascorbate metabolism protein UlaG (beta-lactamase superfamily)